MTTELKHPFFNTESLYAQLRGQTDSDQQFLHGFAPPEPPVRLATSAGSPASVRTPVSVPPVMQAWADRDPLADVRIVVLNSRDDMHEIPDAQVRKNLTSGEWAVVGTGPQGSLVFTIQELKDRVIVWEKSLELPLIARVADSPVTAAAWDGAHRLAVGHTDGTVELHNLSWGDVYVQQIHSSPITQIGIQPDGSVISKDKNHIQNRWTPTTGEIQGSTERIEGDSSIELAPSTPPLQVLTLEVSLPQRLRNQFCKFRGPLLRPNLQEGLRNELGKSEVNSPDAALFSRFVSANAVDNGAIAQMLANVPEFQGPLNSMGSGKAVVLIPTGSQPFPDGTAIVLVCE